MGLPGSLRSIRAKLSAAKVKRAARLVLIGGLVVSAAVSLTFYLLIQSHQQPAPIQAGATSTQIQSWLTDYANWTSTNATYSRCLGFGLVAAVEFGVVLLVLRSPRLALVASFILLNLYFTWTSHLLSDISPQLSDGLTQLITVQDDFFWANGGLGYFVGSSIFVLDLEALILLGGVMGLTFVLNLSKGSRRAVLLATQMAALSMVILGGEIAWFDYPQFYMHVTQAQSLVHFLPEFNNADLLLSAVALFAATTFLLRNREDQGY